MIAKTASLLVLLSAAAGILHARGTEDRIVPSEGLSGLRMDMGGFRGKDQLIAPEVVQVLGQGSYLSRSYANADEPPIDLLIAYYPSQRSGQSIHSPQNCLPGAGWTFEQSGRVLFVDTAHQQHEVAEYLVSNGDTRMEVLYWYRSRGRDIASDYRAKAFLMLQAVRDGRSDGALIRLMTPVSAGESQGEARKRVTAFAAALEPLLPPFLPS